jgi:hypothetical protein
MPRCLCRPVSRRLRTCRLRGIVSIARRPSSEGISTFRCDADGDVSLPERAIRAAGRREFAVRRRAMELLRQDPDRFFALVRDCDQRESAGTKPIDVLEHALDAIGNDGRGRSGTTSGHGAPGSFG